MNNYYKELRLWIMFFIVIGFLGLCGGGCDQGIALMKKVVAPAAPVAAQQVSMVDEDEDVDFSILTRAENVRLKRNFFRPLIGPGSLKEERALEAGLDPDAKVGLPQMTTPEVLGLVLKGVLMAEEPIAFVSSPEDDFVLRAGDFIDTMKVEDISAGEVVFLLENGQIAILSNIKEE
ncbi:MAG: hypothetical protein PHY73_08270 [Candidatus Omnitrophica bacterium]|nr:hypothetical protein [Candidatus Omnitrophota bacterium]